jgi:hypothetical protein
MPSYIIIVDIKLHAFHLVLIMNHHTSVCGGWVVIVALNNLCRVLFLDNSLLSEASRWWNLWQSYNTPLWFVTNNLLDGSHMRHFTYVNRCYKLCKCPGPISPSWRLEESSFNIFIKLQLAFRGLVVLVLTCEREKFALFGLCDLCLEPKDIFTYENQTLFCLLK